MSASNDAVALQEILRQLERATADYNTILAEACAHQDRLAKERAALGALHTRLIGMREPLKGWDASLWNMGWRNGVPREARANAERQIKAHEKLLDDLFWQLLEFREKPEADRS